MADYTTFEQGLFNPYRSLIDVNNMQRPRTTNQLSGDRRGSANNSQGNPRVTRAIAIYTSSASPEGKFPSPPYGGRAKTPAGVACVQTGTSTEEFTTQRGVHGADTMLRDLREAKNSIREYRTEVLQLRAENSRLDQAVRDQEKRIMRISEAAAASGNGSSGNSYESISEARRAVEKSVLVRQLKDQISRLRHEVSQKDVALKSLQRNTKSNALSQLSAEKEEYYFEIIRLRQVVTSLRQDLAAEIANKQHTHIAKAMKQRTPAPFTGDGGSDLRQEISRLTAGFQDILFGLSGSRDTDVYGDRVDPFFDVRLSSASSGASARTTNSRPVSVAAARRKPEADNDSERDPYHGFLRVNPSATTPSEDAMSISLGMRDDRDDLRTLTLSSPMSPDERNGLFYSPVKAQHGILGEEVLHSPIVAGSSHPKKKAAAAAAEDAGKTPVPPQGPKGSAKRAKANSLRSSRELKAAALVVSTVEVESANSQSPGLQTPDKNAEVLSEETKQLEEKEPPVRLDVKLRAFLVGQMKDIFKRILTDGAFDVEALFNHFDEDGNGQLIAQEIHSGLSDLPAFSEVTEQQAEALLQELDHDGNGHISIDEFKAFVYEERAAANLVNERRDRPTRKHSIERKKVIHVDGKSQGAVLPKNATLGEFAKGVRSTFAKTVAEGYSLEEFFREMDADGDGQISALEMQTILVRYPYFASVTVDQIDALLREIATVTQKDLSVNPEEPTIVDFKKFLENEEKDAGATVIQKLMKKHRLSVVKENFEEEKESSEQVKSQKRKAPAVAVVQEEPHLSEKFRKGDKVEGRFGGRDAFFPATVEAINDTTLHLVYDDGDVERDAKPENVRLRKVEPPTPVPPVAATPSNDVGETSGDYADDFEGETEFC